MTVGLEPPRETAYVWRYPGEDKREEVERLTAEGKKVVQISWSESDVIERDGRGIPVPRYGGAGRDEDDCLEGEVTEPRAMIGHTAEAEAELQPEADPDVPAPAALPDSAVRYERERIDAWIRNRLIAYPLASCFGCRKPIVAGAAWEEVSNGDTNARARFHRACHVEWRSGREAAARQALGLAG